MARPKMREHYASSVEAAKRYVEARRSSSEVRTLEFCASQSKQTAVRGVSSHARSAAQGAALRLLEVIPALRETSVAVTFPLADFEALVRAFLTTVTGAGKPTLSARDRRERFALDVLLWFGGLPVSPLTPAELLALAVASGFEQPKARGHAALYDAWKKRHARARGRVAPYLAAVREVHRAVPPPGMEQVIAGDPFPRLRRFFGIRGTQAAETKLRRPPKPN